MKYTMYFAGLIACFFSIVAAQAQESKFLNSPARKLQLAEFAIANLYVDEVNEGKLVEEAIVKMLEQLDPHSTYSDPEEVKRMNEPLQGNFEGIGIQFNMAEDTLLVIQPVSGGPSEKVGILAGDRIVMVEDTLIAGVKMSTEDIMRRLRGPKDSKVNLKILRRGVKELLPFTVKRDKIPVYSLDASYMIKDKIGYIRINRFAATTHEEFKKALTGLQKKGMKDLILDLQGNGGGNAELQYYTNGNPNNVNVKNGNLIITAKKESLENNDYTSTRIVSKNKNDMLYGRIEIKAKLPNAVGTWPAIWMMPTDSEYGEWPKSGEIDIMEHVGYDLGVVHGTVHTEKYYWKKSNQKGAKIDVANPDENFAVYAMEWTPNIIKIYKDNILYFEYEKEELSSEAWPFDKKFYLIMNIAIGGAWGGQQGVDENNFPQEMVVDYVRVYDLGIDNN